MNRLLQFVQPAVKRSAALGVAAMVMNPMAAAAQPAVPPALGGAESFAVLSGAAVTNTGASTFSGDVGANAGGTITGITPAMFAPGGALHEGDAVAVQGHHSAVLAYENLAARTCLPANDKTGQNLGGQSLSPGVYCFDGDAPLTGTLTLTGAGPWIFQIGGALTVAPGAAVVAPVVAPDTCGGSDVFWQIGDNLTATPLTPTTIGAGATFVGSILSLGDITMATGAALDGRAVSLGETTGTIVAGGNVTLAANAIRACSYGTALPTLAPFKVTGGGSINVPNNPAEKDPDATGTGFANYGFNAQPGAAGAPATGNFNYVNHVIGPHLHANGDVTDVDVLALNDDRTARTVRFSGTCNRLLPDCTFSVMVEDNGEPGRNDQFGVTIVSNDRVLEERAMRQVRNGNIQFHSAALTTTINTPTIRHGQTMRLSARLRRDATGTTSDAYVVLRLPGGQMMSWTGSSLVPGLAPLVRNFVPVDYDGQLLQLQVPAGTPAGTYTWMSALTEAGTLNLLSPIAERSFTVTP